MLSLPFGMDRHANRYQGDADNVARSRELAEDDRADGRREHRQQRQHERERGPGQPCHRQLIGQVRDDGGAQADAHAGQQQDRTRERRQRAGQSDRGDSQRRDKHRRGCGGRRGPPPDGRKTAATGGAMP
jgi:hypothetical protein